MPDQTIYQAPRRAERPGEAIVTSTCGHNCGGRCVVNAHVVDDRIVKISTDPARWQPELPPLHACGRGVGQIERTYHPDRLQYPLRRTGPRGISLNASGAWELSALRNAWEMGGLLTAAEQRQFEGYWPQTHLTALQHLRASRACFPKPPGQRPRQAAGHRTQRR